MRSLKPRPNLPKEVRRRLERLDGLPLRPASVRAILNSLPDDDEVFSEPWESPTPSPPPITEIDPGWVLSQMAPGRARDPLDLIAGSPWWSNIPGAAGEALIRLWRHSVAVGQAARRLAREAGDPHPDRIARAGLLHGLGWWAVAAVEPQWLAEWVDESDLRRRREFERLTLGTEWSTVGRELAESWGCDPIVVDASWLHADADRGLNGCASDPDRLAIVQEAYAWAERTPWALSPPNGLRDRHASDPRLRLLIAEVQVRCGAAFVEPDASPHEERLARSNSRLRRQIHQLRIDSLARDQFLDAFVHADPSDSPETWARDAGLRWCNAPGVNAARVVWAGPGTGAEPRIEAGGTSVVEASPGDERPASLIVPLTDRGLPCAEVHLWTGTSGIVPAVDIHALRSAWQAWAVLIADRERLGRRLEEAIRVHRDQVVSEELRLQQAKLEALAEFAAGAGHELNNPLAVIVGRAQLLLARETEPGAIRSLNAILTQAQRAHRILRDLIYVARPPEPRPRCCQPEEIVRNCVRDLLESADERGIRLLADARGAEAKVWADPDALRHVTEVLLRNALEATPKGGTVQLKLKVSRATAATETLVWTVQDDGRGINAAEGMHLFDPFYCGRQAGRGLGLGLPRAAQIVARAGGEIRWHSTPGQGTLFHVHLPLTAPPRPPQSTAEAVCTNPQVS